MTNSNWGGWICITFYFLAALLKWYQFFKARHKKEPFTHDRKLHMTTAIYFTVLFFVNFIILYKLNIIFIR